ncbi:MAG TPA: hypothetical protein VFU80_04480, partial [Sphingomicrobium sp.]|nr:hypothetical protein [Sphingomicrobium sp.]
GTFVLDYRGEILLQRPDEKEKPAVPWSDSMARCFDDGRTEILSVGSSPADEEGVRPCTQDERAKLKAEHDQSERARIDKELKESEEMAKLFGIPGLDDESNKRFAANLMKYRGWKSVRYKGDGVFDVDYHFEGRVDQDFAFPLMPDSDYVIPFVAIRGRSDGAVMVTAPAFAGGGGPFSARARALGLPDKSSGGPTSQADGRFTVITDGEILTNNSEDGPAPHASGRQVHWDVDPATTRLPETLIRLK